MGNTGIEDILNEIVELRQRIESSKQLQFKLQGQLEELYKRLNNEFGYSSLEEAEEFLKNELSEIETLRESIVERLHKLRTTYNL